MEGKKKGAQYDKNKQRIVPQPPFPSFEHIFFIIFKDTAQIALQSKRIFGFKEMTYSTMQTNFFIDAI